MSDSIEKTVTDQLETLIDRHGLTHILVGLVCVCDEKAEHLCSNWQDKASARYWRQDARTIEKAAVKVNN